MTDLSGTLKVCTRQLCLILLKTHQVDTRPTSLGLELLFFTLMSAYLPSWLHYYRKSKLSLTVVGCSTEMSTFGRAKCLKIVFSFNILNLDQIVPNL